MIIFIKVFMKKQVYVISSFLVMLIMLCFVLLCFILFVWAARVWFYCRQTTRVANWFSKVVWMRYCGISPFNTTSVNAFDWKPVFVHQYSKKTNLGCCLISDFTHARDVTKRRNGERGADSGERGTRNGERGAGSGERGTKVWERVVSRNLRKNPKWPVRITNPVRSMIEKRRNNTWRRYFSIYAHEVLEIMRR